MADARDSKSRLARGEGSSPSSGTMETPFLIAVVGPTASGKSALGVYLAKKLHGEIISADSRQVYKELTIGTGKITPKEMEGVTHHLLDVISPKRRFTVSEYVKKGTPILHAIHARKHIPIIVGGTGLYADALLGRISFPEVPPNPSLRARLEKKSTAALYALLKKKDPRRAKTIETDHKRRLIRALEIAYAIGKTPPPSKKQTYKILWLGVHVGENMLRKKIHDRLLKRVQEGMVSEARRLHVKGLSYKRMTELGLEYAYLALLLQKKLSRERFMEELERAIVKYTKRQMRWFKRNQEIIWVKNKSEALTKAKQFLSV